jgi:hypothetical protein
MMRSSYFGDAGFATEFPTNNFELWQQKFTKIWRQNWIDQGTRAVVITINVVNPNIQVCTVVKIVFEIDSAGNVAPSYRLRSFDLDNFDSSSIIL